YVYFDKPYYLVPGKKGEKGYVLLRETLRRTKKAGIAKVVIRTRQYLAALLVEGDALVLNLLRFHDELRDVSDYDFPGRKLEDYKISPKEIEMAQRLVASMSGPWEPAKYHDDYRDALMQWIEEKAEKGETQPLAEAGVAEPKETDTGVINIMDLLKKSVENTAKTRGTAASKPAKAAKTTKSAAKPATKPAAKGRAKSGKRKRAS
ncbi:MAG TPA: Ku protein, partial [Phycisphaerae bacterium]|nr:Ku protein [Phycisphaerae bacterium]